MADLKLGRLADRTPIKLSIHVLPELDGALREYARIYAEIYGREEQVTTLVPAMLDAFLQADREFLRRRK